MVYVIISIIACSYSLIASYYRNSRLYPVIGWMYGITSAIMALFQVSDWRPVFMMRYFLYMISAILLIFVPFILCTLSILIILRDAVKQTNVFRKMLDYFLASIILSFFGYSLYTIINIREAQMTIILSLYSSIAIFLSALFMSYLMVCMILKFTKIRQQPYLIMILGTDIDDDGQVKFELRRRLNRALKFYNRLDKEIQQQCYFLVSGGNPISTGKSEAEAMANYLKEQAIPKSQIIEERSARNTNENFIFSRGFINHIGKNKRLLVVSSTYHLPRSSYFARFNRIFSIQSIGSRTAWYHFPYAVTREFIALLLLSKEICMSYMVYIIITEMIKILN